MIRSPSFPSISWSRPSPPPPYVHTSFSFSPLFFFYSLPTQQKLKRLSSHTHPFPYSYSLTQSSLATHRSPITTTTTTTTNTSTTTFIHPTTNMSLAAVVRATVVPKVPRARKAVLTLVRFLFIFSFWLYLVYAFLNAVHTCLSSTKQPRLR